MTIEDFASIGEIIGAAATVLTLVYLAVQIRENTQITSAQTAQATHARNDLYATSLAENPQLAELFHRGLIDFDSLTDGERIQLTFLFSMIVGVVEGEFDAVNRGLGDPVHLERSIAGISGLLRMPGGRRYWELYSKAGGYTSDFVSFIDKHLKE
jgi:hypothetical protein